MDHLHPCQPAAEQTIVWYDRDMPKNMHAKSLSIGMIVSIALFLTELTALPVQHALAWHVVVCSCKFCVSCYFSVHKFARPCQLPAYLAGAADSIFHSRQDWHCLQWQPAVAKWPGLKCQHAQWQFMSATHSLPRTCCELLLGQESPEADRSRTLHLLRRFPLSACRNQHKSVTRDPAIVRHECIRVLPLRQFSPWEDTVTATLHMSWTGVLQCVIQYSQ